MFKHFSLNIKELSLPLKNSLIINSKMLILFKLQKKLYKYLINSSTLPCHNHLPLFSAYHPNFLCIPNTATKLFWIIIVVGVKWWLKERSAKTKINFLLASAFEQQCGDKKRHARKIETKKRKNEMRHNFISSFTLLWGRRWKHLRHVNRKIIYLQCLTVL